MYQQLLADGCTPNLVTFNIMIDIHGKSGQWARAVEVLDQLQAQVQWAGRCCEWVGVCSMAVAVQVQWGRRRSGAVDGGWRVAGV